MILCILPYLWQGRPETILMGSRDARKHLSKIAVRKQSTFLPLVMQYWFTTTLQKRCELNATSQLPQEPIVKVPNIGYRIAEIITIKVSIMSWCHTTQGPILMDWRKAISVERESRGPMIICFDRKYILYGTYQITTQQIRVGRK